MRRILSLVGLIVLLGVVSVSAQIPSVIINRPFTVQASHDGLYTTEFRLTITGPMPYTATVPVSALSGGIISFTVPGLNTIGSYSLTVSAEGPGGVGTSDPLAFTVVVTGPNRPNNVRIVVGG